MKKILLVVSLLISWSAFACINGSLELNDDSILYADGFYSVKENITYDLQQDIINRGYTKLTAYDSQKHPTHKVEILGQLYNKNGKLMSATYLILDLETGEESVHQVRTNQQSDGSSTRSIGESLVNVHGC